MLASPWISFRLTEEMGRACRTSTLISSGPRQPCSCFSRTPGSHLVPTVTSSLRIPEVSGILGWPAMQTDCSQVPALSTYLPFLEATHPPRMCPRKTKDRVNQPVSCELGTSHAFRPLITHPNTVHLDGCCCSQGFYCAYTIFLSDVIVL